MEFLDSNSFESFWLLNFWQQQYGLAQALFFAKRSFVRPRVGIVLSAEHPRSEELRLQLLSAQTEYGSRIERIGSHGFAFESHVFQTFFEGRDAMSLHAQGLFSFPSAGSQAVVHGLSLTLWRKPVWDMCAGFGGKSALLAHYGVALSLCTDTSHTRLKGLRSDFARRGLPIPSCLLSDAITPPLTRFHGHILLDTPCSGLGILSRRPDLRRARKNKRSLRLFPRQQKALLASAYSCLERGCELAYITCTLSPAENEEQINAFLKEHPDLELLRVYRTPSDDLGYEGMFGALLRRF